MNARLSGFCDLRSLLRAALGLFLVFPVLVITGFSKSWDWPDHTELLESLSFTTIQAFLSSLFTMILGAGGALGLISFSQGKLRSASEVFALLPSLLPPLFVILPYLNMASFFHFEPFGLWGIVSVNILMNLGLTSVVLARVIESKLGPMIELSWIEGASRWKMVQSGVFSYLRADLVSFSFYLFTLYFASFSIPLILGSSEGVTLEVLIYEKIRLSGNWSQSVLLGLLQIFILFLFSFGVRQNLTGTISRQPNLTGLRVPFLFGIPFFVSFFLVVGQFFGFVRGWGYLLNSPVLLTELPSLLSGTLIVGIGTGLVVFLLLILVAGLGPHPGLDRFLVGYTAPSTVLTGFAFLLLGVDSWPGVHLSLICGLAILVVPSLYRMLARGLLVAIQNQVIVARLGGSGWWAIFDKIVFPQICRQFWWLAGMSSLWACGDYALSSLVVENNTTLALAIKGYMTSYHLDLATALNSILLVVGMSCLLGFGGLGRVCRTESFS
ncbi:MAG: hypothetical protein IPJ71_09005 [Bdellovibrionales bacterium]|nr:hypothetical protein [Bdellovibrionales bacterium]